MQNINSFYLNIDSDCFIRCDDQDSDRMLDEGAFCIVNNSIRIPRDTEDIMWGCKGFGEHERQRGDEERENGGEGRREGEKGEMRGRRDRERKSRR